MPEDGSPRVTQLEDLNYGVPLSVKKPNIVIFAPNG